MSSYEFILENARKLSLDDRLRLIGDLWDDCPENEAIELHPAWEEELKRRRAAIDDGTAKLIPWEEVRAKLLKRIGNDAQD